MSGATGAVVINTSLSHDVQTSIGAYIEQKFSKIQFNISELLADPPSILCRNISASIAMDIVGHLAGLGISATFIPNTNSVHVSISAAENTNNSVLPAEIEELRREVRLDEGRPLQHEFPEDRRARLLQSIAEVNKELWIILSMVAIAALVNFAVASQYLLLGLYTLPTVMSAYYFGRRQAVMTALASLITVGIVAHFSPGLFQENIVESLGSNSKWYHIVSWGCILMVTAYAMGTLYERSKERLQELRDTYQGLLLILRHFISQDEYTENHCYRTSIYATKIAIRMGMSEEFVQDVRSAALLHDIGKLKVSRDILYKAARLSGEDRQKIEKHVDNGAGILEPMKGPLGRILPMILGHHDKFDGSGYREFAGETIPIGARILAVADVYDALVSDRPYRKAMSPFEVKEIIIRGIGKEFDPAVVDAFVVAFDRREMESPNVII